MKTITIQVPDGCEVQIVRKEKEKKPVIRTYQDIYDSSSNIPPLDNNWAVQALCESTKVTEKVAKSMLAMSMISQLMPYYGGAVTDEEWKDCDICKYCLLRETKNVTTTLSKFFYHFLAFHTAEQRDNFFKYNEQLVKDYLMIE